MISHDDCVVNNSDNASAMIDHFPGSFKEEAPTFQFSDTTDLSHSLEETIGNQFQEIVSTCFNNGQVEGEAILQALLNFHC